MTIPHLKGILLELEAVRSDVILCRFLDSQILITEVEWLPGTSDGGDGFQPIHTVHRLWVTTQIVELIDEVLLQVVERLLRIQIVSLTATEHEHLFRNDGIVTFGHVVQQVLVHL